MAEEAARLAALENRLGWRFVDRGLLERAITHRSWATERGRRDHYERLEFLGDAVVGLVAAESAYRREPERSEGELSREKAHLISAPVLARYAAWIGLGDLLRLGVGEERSGGRGKESLLADALEAVIGALFLDGGFEPAQRAVRTMLDEVRGWEEVPPARDAKTALQERAQARGWPLPVYRVVAERGPDHDKLFTIECELIGGRVSHGEGRSKKEAEQRAASAALASLADE